MPLPLAAIAVGATAVKGGMDFLSKMSQAKSIGESRKRLKYQMQLDMVALKDRMESFTGGQVNQIATSGFKYGGSKAKMVNDAIYQFKLREAEYLNRYNLQRKALKIAKRQTKIGAFMGLAGDVTKVGMGIKGLPSTTSTSPLLNKTTPFGSLAQPLNARSVFSGGQLSGRRRLAPRQTYGIKLGGGR